MIDIAQISTNLELSESGQWLARGVSPVFYPDYGAELCLGLEEDSFWFRHRNRCILSALRRLPPAGAVFDIGGGNGYVSLGILQAGFEAILVEPGRQAVHHARQRGLKTTICAAFEDAGFRPACLPAVGLFDVLEHIPDEKYLLEAIHTALVPGGLLYLTVPAYNFLWSSEDEAAEHFRRYTLGALKRLLSAGGFEIALASYFFAPLPLPILLLRALPSRLGLRREINPQQEKAEHRAAPGLAGRFLDRVLAAEARLIERGAALPFGGSCLVVARRPA